MSELVNYTYWLWKEAISKEVCDAILNNTDFASYKDAKVTAQAVLDPEARISETFFVDAMQPVGCIARTYIESANQQAGWGYALDGQENTQITRYRGDVNGHYDWHMDTTYPKNGIQRKLTCVLLLSDPSEFEGGILQLKGFEDKQLLTNKGDIVVFPSFIEHKVTAVTTGVRFTAVTWAIGPSFK